MFRGVRGTKERELRGVGLRRGLGIRSGTGLGTNGFFNNGFCGMAYPSFY